MHSRRRRISGPRRTSGEHAIVFQFRLVSFCALHVCVCVCDVWVSRDPCDTLAPAVPPPPPRVRENKSEQPCRVTESLLFTVETSLCPSCSLLFAKDVFSRSQPFPPPHFFFPLLSAWRGWPSFYLFLRLYFFLFSTHREEERERKRLTKLKGSRSQSVHAGHTG